MMFGRPHMISSYSNVPLPSLIDDEYLLSDGEGYQPVNCISYLGMFVSTIKLFEIMTDILSVFYTQKDNSAQNGRSDMEWWHPHCLADVLRINSLLDNFQNTLPSHLKVQHVTADDWNRKSLEWLQAIVLNCRFANLPGFHF
jgi:hypothetical protein